MLFLCLNAWHKYEDEDKPLGLRTGSTNVMINAKADPESQHPSVSEDFRAILHVLQEDYNVEEDFAKILKAKLDKINEDPVTRRKIMTLQTRLEDEKAIGIEEGRRKGLQEAMLGYYTRLVKKLGYTEDQAMEVLGCTRAELESYKKLAEENKKLK